LYLFPLLASGIRNLGHFDSDSAFYYLEAVRKTVFEYGQFPFWDPWHMGGMPLMGSPGAPFSPFYLPVVLFGTVVGAKISLFIMHLIGFAGTYFLARYFGLSHLPGILAASVWSFNGMHSVQIQAGWFLFSHLHLIPWLLLCFLKYRDDLRMSAVMGMLLALTLLGGSLNIIPIAYLPLGVMGLYFAISERSARPITFLAASTAVFVLLAAFKIIPTYIWISSNPRDLQNLVEGYSAAAFFWSLSDPLVNLEYNTANLFSTGSIPGSAFYVAPEFGMYAGPIVLVLAVAGLFAKFPHKGALLTAMVVLIFVSMGDYALVPLWGILKKFPVYDSMRVVTRFRWPFILLVSLLAAFGARRLASFFPRKELFTKAVTAAVLASLYVAAWPVLSASFIVPPEKALLDFNKTGNYFQVWQTGWYTEHGWIDGYKFRVTAMFPYIKENVGVAKGYEPMDIKIYARGIGSPDYKGEAFLHTPKGFRKASIVGWSPNRVSIAWEKGQTGDLYLNQNYMEGWKTCGKPGGLKIMESGLIRVPISENDSGVDLCYAPGHAYAGIVISLLTFFACVVFIFKNSRFMT
ncbi:MAG: hypothetical protein V3S46_08025, partial [Nitrospinota bacterium]